MSESLRGLHLHLDCASGAAGDMTLGALFDLGVPVHVVTEAVHELGLGTERVLAERAIKRGIRATDVRVRAEPAASDEDHHEHRHYGEIRDLIRGAGLADDVVRRAFDIFDRVARAEAEIHGCTVEEVTFHEVGAIDSIVDIVGTAAALTWLRPASVSCAAVAMGHGTVECAHGLLPVPAPAALAILTEAGAVMTDGGLARELCTPTGAAILASAVTYWGPMPAMTPLSVGYGAGDADLPDRANVMRAVVGRPVVSGASDTVYRIDANIDDMSPELLPHAAEVAFAAGALDVWWTAITMKHGRPAVMLSTIVSETLVDPLVSVILRETSTLGVRLERVARRVLERERVWVETDFGRARVKVARDGAGEVVNAAPEYEDCRALAREAGVPLERVFRAVTAGYETRGGTAE